MSWEFISNLLLASVRMATPLIFLALAELYSQRAGLVHIGLEGLASIGSLVGFLVSLITGNPFLGVLAGAAAGILVNMIYAYATITLCAEQIVYGMAINIFAPALASFIYRVYFGAGSELVQVSLMETLASRMGITANGFIAKLFLDQTPMVYLAYPRDCFRPAQRRCRYPRQGRERQRILPAAQRHTDRLDRRRSGGPYDRDRHHRLYRRHGAGHHQGQV